MEGLCQPTHDIRMTEDEVHDWLEENCVCHGDPTIKWEQLEEKRDEVEKY